MRFNIEITASKILSFIIFFTGLWYSIHFNDSKVLITSITSSSALMGIKTGIAGYVKMKKGI